MRRLHIEPVADAEILEAFEWYAAFFVVDPELIRVVGVVHGRRHPRRWQRRE